MGRNNPHWPDECRPWTPALPPCRHEMCRHSNPWRPPEPPWRPQEHCCRDDTSIKVRLFDGCGRPCDPCGRQLAPAAPPVTVVNPWNCHECAQVTLSVDDCGNLVVCIKR